MQPFNTACKNCRVAKTKCLRVDDNDDDGKCRRCRGAGWECSLMPRAARKRRKRMHAKVEVLEGQLREIEQLMGRAKGRGLEMGQERNEPTMGKEVPPAVMLPLTPDSAGVDEGSRTMTLPAASFGGESAVVDERAMEMDVLREETTTLPGIVPDILAFGTASRLFEKFREETVTQFPLLHLPPNTTFSDLAAHKPTLLLATITAASMSTTGSLFKTLHTELTTRLAMKVIVSGERSLELVQAVLTMEVWYCFPEDLEDRESGVNFYQWIHVAATMALQLGLGGRWDEKDREKGMEEARIALAVWASCSSAAVSLRRENIMKLTPSLQQCLQRFSANANSTHDKSLLARVQLQMISEEAHSITPSQEHIRSSFLAKTSDLAAQVYCFQRQLEVWEKGLEEGVMNESLLIHYLYIKTKFLEIPLHAYHDLSKLIAYPFVCKDDSANQQQSIPSIMAPVYLRVANPFMDACHNLLDTFASFSPEILANLPTVPFVRAIYALNALQLLVKVPAFKGDVEVRKRIEVVKGRVEGFLSAAVGKEGRSVPLVVLGVWRRIGGPESRRVSMVSNLEVGREPSVGEMIAAEERPCVQPISNEVPSSGYEMGPTYPDNSQNMMDLGSTNSLSTIQEYNFAGIDDRMMETFLNGFGAADLIT